MQYRPVLLLFFFLALGFIARSQDKIYTRDGRILAGKVTEVGPREVKYTTGEGPVYVLYTYDIDSIVYASGRTDILGRHGVRPKTATFSELLLNTITVDIFGAIFNSFSISYERKVADNKIGLRFPLYVNTSGPGMAGYGTFSTGSGVYYYDGIFPTPQGPFERYGFCIATGINPKFYLIKHRIVRPFIGPEADIGISKDNTQNYYGYPVVSTVYRQTTFAAMVKLGLSINPRGGPFNMVIDGGVGAGDFIGSGNVTGWTGLWHIGFSLGGCFNANLSKNGFPSN